VGLVGVLAVVLTRKPPSPLPPPPPTPLPLDTAVVSTALPAEEAREDESFDKHWVPAVVAGLPTTHIDQEITVDAVGDATLTAVLRFPPEHCKAFKRRLSVPYMDGRELKWRPPNMRHVLGFLDVESAESVTEDLDGRFEDPAIRVCCRERGWAHRQEGRWSTALTTDRDAKYEVTRKVYRDGVPTVTVDALVKTRGVQVVSRRVLTLPRGAHDIRIEGTPNKITYRAPPPAQTPAGSGGTPRLTLQVKPHVMSALYKMYGDRRFEKLWVARGVFRNDGTTPVTDCRTRFRLAGWSEWSRYETTDVVLPGQTVVVPFYPVIDSKVREQRDSTPADVEAEYSYVRADGRRVAETTTERTKILGINEAVFSDMAVSADSAWVERYKDAPLVLASFVSAADPVIQDVVGLVSKATRGAGAALGDAEAMAFLKGFYDLTRANISYETTPGNVIDGLNRQHLKYGRDVLRTRSGTCVNTAILFASVAEAAGLDALVWVVPGHAFAGARLPRSGWVVAVETTGCGGGTLETSMDFARAVQSAARTAQKWQALGLIIEVDVRQLRREGVVPPELPDGGRNPLREWGIRASAAAGPAPAGPAEEPEDPAGETSSEEDAEEDPGMAGRLEGKE
jgi:hypothetical protein